MLSGLSPMHLLLILIIVLAVFGTGKLRNIGKDLGGAVKGFKEAMREGDDKPQPPQQISQQPAQPAVSEEKKNHV